MVADAGGVGAPTLDCRKLVAEFDKAGLAKNVNYKYYEAERGLRTDGASLGGSGADQMLIYLLGSDSVSRVDRPLDGFSGELRKPPPPPPTRRCFGAPAGLPLWQTVTSCGGTRARRGQVQLDDADS